MEKKMITIVIVSALATGCNMPSVPEAKEQAYNRWYETRANVLCELGTDYFKIGNLKKAKGKIGEALSLDPDNKDARLLLAKIHIEQEAYGLAMGELSRLRGECPANPDVAYLLGVAQEKSRLFDDALVSYRQSQSLDQSNVAAVIAAAEVLASQGKVRQAQLYVESYINIASNDPGMYELAGRLAMMRGEYDKAARYYQHAHDLDIKNVPYIESLAKAQFLSGMSRRAAETLESLTVLKDYATPAWVFTMLGDCQMTMGMKHRAREAYLRATEIKPTDAGVWSNLAKAALALEDIPRAIIAARQSLKLDAQCLNGAMLLGYAMLRNGQIEQSLRILTDAARAHPDSADLRCVLGRAYAAAGNHQQARNCYAEAIRIEPGNLLARELLGTQESEEPTEVN